MLAKLRYFFFKRNRNRYLQQMYTARDPWSSVLTFSLISEKIRSELKGRKFSAALDVGCGEGQYAPVLAEFAGSYLGTDVSLQALTRAQAAFPKFEFINRDFDRLSAPERKFDLILFNFALDYLGFQDHPQHFTANLYSFIQNCVADNAVVLIFNPVYKTETWDRLQKYQFLLETFGFTTIRREMLSAPELQIGYLAMQFKTR